MFKKIYLALPLLLIACAGSNPSPMASSEPSDEFNKYWYSNEAEITSYKLEQARYGEIHEGTAALVFVTEPFSRKTQVKADNPGKDDPSVLKLNFTKKFNTGIYPYSMISSTFIPVKYPQEHALKVAMSSQEWCGHTYTQLNNRNGKYDITSHSYFEGEADENFSLDQQWLEDELWLKLRINPSELPTGEMKLIPSFFYTRLMHKEVKAYSAVATNTNGENGQMTYHIKFPELNRELSIFYNSQFPYGIEGWEEVYISGFANPKQLVTKATKIKSIKSDYWNRNNNKDSYLREELGLE